jgi:hypothetical protein
MMPSTGISLSRKLSATEEMTAFALGAGPPENNMPTLLNFGFTCFSLVTKPGTAINSVAAFWDIMP